MAARGVEFLRVRGQAEDGSFSKQNGLGITALITAGILSVDVPRDDAMVAKSLAYLEGFKQADGGIYAPNSKHANYETCLAIMAFAKANHDGKYAKLLADAEAYVKKLQWTKAKDSRARIRPSVVRGMEVSHALICRILPFFLKTS